MTKSAPCFLSRARHQRRRPRSPLVDPCAEPCRHALSHGLVVVDDENARHGTRILRGRRGASCEAETSAAFWAAVNGHFAAMVARDLAHEGQTNPVPSRGS